MESLQDIIAKAKELAKEPQTVEFLCIKDGRWLIVDDPELWEVKVADRVIEVPYLVADFLWKQWRERQDFDFLAVLEEVQRR